MYLEELHLQTLTWNLRLSENLASAPLPSNCPHLPTPTTSFFPPPLSPCQSGETIETRPSLLSPTIRSHLGNEWWERMVANLPLTGRLAIVDWCAFVSCQRSR